MTEKTTDSFVPNHEVVQYTDEERYLLEPFFTNLDKPVYASQIFSPEVIGALCSRASRAAGDLRTVFLKEYIVPFIHPERTDKDTDESWNEKIAYGENLKAFIDFIHAHPVKALFSNPRARSFYIKWLAQYGDDSIAQLAGMHLGFSSLSQIAIKHIEDQRIGLAPIEKSTRYVDYSIKVNGHYQYYTDPTLNKLGLTKQYEAAMDRLFETNLSLRPKLMAYLQKRFPDEKPSVVEKKAFDTLRGLLPSATLSQVAFFGNGQAFEYLIARSRHYPLGEIRWTAEAVLNEMNEIGPSFVRRLLDETRKEGTEAYQKYLGERRQRMAPFASQQFGDKLIEPTNQPHVALLDADPDGETKIIAGMLYTAPNNHRRWSEVEDSVRKLSEKEKVAIIEAYLEGREQRWQKVGRALENSYVRFEIVMNIGAWRDLQRHRMLSQQRQNFSCHHGYDVPEELIEAGLDGEFRSAIDQTEQVFAAINKHDQELAQYATTLAHRMRFTQFTNLRSCFWEMELRTIPEGHPDYRSIEQEKFRLLQKAFPLLTNYMHVNMENYDFARRGQEERIAAKLKTLVEA